MQVKKLSIKMGYRCQLQFHQIVEMLIQDVKAWVISEGIWRMLEHIIIVYLIIKLARGLFVERRGKKGFIDVIVKLGIRFGKRFKFFQNKINNQLSKQASKTVSQMIDKTTIKSTYRSIPEQGYSQQTILSQIKKRKQADLDPTAGKTFAYVYEHSKKHSELTAKCFNQYIHYNALNPIVFNSLRVFENQTVKMVSTLFHGNDQCVGNMTSCGTESLILAMKTYRDYRGKGHILKCVTGHPGINKGCSYVGLDVIEVEEDQKHQMSIADLKKKISKRTVVVVASAAQYPHGVVDDIVKIAEVCRQYNVPLHVDAAIGGFVIPFVQMLGKNKFGPWDFRVPGVTSINADIHKYGYCPKGASVLVFSNSEIRRNQFYSFSTWPGGIYISPTILGSRNGGCIVAGWSSLMSLGIEGFKKTTADLLNTVDKVVNYVNKHPDLELVADPHMSIVAFTSKSINIFKIADCLDDLGFKVQKQSNPDCIHMSLMPQHVEIVDKILSTLGEAIEQVKTNPDKYEGGTKAMYGMLAKIPDELIVEDFMHYFMDEVYKF